VFAQFLVDAVSTASRPAAGSTVEALAPKLAGGMKLGLSAAEQEARQAVQLPFQHQGQVRGCGPVRMAASA
jgi:hypothetical protein